MAITQVAHICLHVKDVEKTIDFYTRVLGLKVRFEFYREQDGSIKGAYLDAGNKTYIEFFQTDKDLPAQSNIAHMCLEVDSIDRTIHDVNAAGWEITEKKLGADQSWQAWVTDPDGVRIELHEYTDNSSQNTGNNVTVSW